MKIPPSMQSFAEKAILPEHTGLDYAGQERKPTLIDRLESINAHLAQADDTFAVTRTGLWGDYASPTVTGNAGDGQLLAVLDVIEKRVAAVQHHAVAFQSELGR